MKLSDTEWKVMRVVWRKSPASARDVLESLPSGTDWAYTTVKTILARLTEKGALRARMRANTSYYEPLVSREQARRSAVRSLIESAFDGTFGSLLHHLVGEEKLSARDRARLVELLESESGAPRGDATADGADENAVDPKGRSAKR